MSTGAISRERHREEFNSEERQLTRKRHILNGVDQQPTRSNNKLTDSNSLTPRTHRVGTERFKSVFVDATCVTLGVLAGLFVTGGLGAATAGAAIAIKTTALRAAGVAAAVSAIAVGAEIVAAAGAVEAIGAEMVAAAGVMGVGIVALQAVTTGAAVAGINCILNYRRVDQGARRWIGAVMCAAGVATIAGIGISATAVRVAVPLTAGAVTAFFSSRTR